MNNKKIAMFVIPALAAMLIGGSLGPAFAVSQEVQDCINEIEGTKSLLDGVEITLSPGFFKNPDKGKDPKDGLADKLDDAITKISAEPPKIDKAEDKIEDFKQQVFKLYERGKISGGDKDDLVYEANEDLACIADL